MNDLYIRYPVISWIIASVIWIEAIFFLVLTYIIAPLKSKKEGHYVSGFPGIAFVLFLIA